MPWNRHCERGDVDGQSVGLGLNRDLLLVSISSFATLEGSQSTPLGPEQG